MADNVMTYRLVVKEIAYANGVYATFMPKPIQGENGSGMHVHQSLFTKDGNAFFDANDPEGFNLSTIGKQLHRRPAEVRARVLRGHQPVRELATSAWCRATRPPSYVSWARRNRSAMVRVPMYKPGKENATRVELRSPDPACNPYLAFAVMLGAGLKGIEEELTLLPGGQQQHLQDDRGGARRRPSIKTLPKDLGEAIELFEKSALMKEVLGEHIHSFFVENKKAEWAEYVATVTEWEQDKYLSIL